MAVLDVVLRCEPEGNVKIMFTWHLLNDLSWAPMKDRPDNQTWERVERWPMGWFPGSSRNVA